MARIDEKLLEAARAGDRKALGELLELLQPRIYGDLVAPLVDEDRAAKPVCPDIVSVLSKHLEGDLSAERCAEMERHVASCPHCDATCQFLRSVLATCSSLRTERIPPEVAEPIRARVRELLAKVSV
jgi:RNA polymerase sigma-70 factor, ECF subfamily